MIAVEIETPIIDHQINIFSDQLPAQSRRAKVIVMFDEAEPEAPHQSVLASLRANRGAALMETLATFDDDFVAALEAGHAEQPVIQEREPL